MLRQTASCPFSALPQHRGVGVLYGLIRITLCFAKGVSRTLSPRFFLRMKRTKKKRKKTERKRSPNGKKRKKRKKKRKETEQMEENGKKQKKTERKQENKQKSGKKNGREQKRTRKKSEATPFRRPVLRKPESHCGRRSTADSHPCSMNCCATILTYTEKRKAYTTTTERKSIGELFWPQRKTFQAGGGYKNPIKSGKPYPPPKSFLCGPHFFCKEKFCTGAGRCMVSFFFQIHACKLHFRSNFSCAVTPCIIWSKSPAVFCVCNAICTGVLHFCRSCNHGIN